MPDVDRTNLTKIREWADVEGHERDQYGDYDWPAPPEYTEYRVEGQMRADVLACLGREADDTSTVRLIEGLIEGGYSEYTVEHDYEIEVWVDGDRQSQKVFDTVTWSSEKSLASFLRWITEGAA